QLAFAPSGIAERRDPRFRAAAFGDCPQDVDRPGHGKEVAVGSGDVERVLPAPVAGMQHEAPPRLDRPAMVDGDVGGLALVDLELLEQAAEPDPGPLVADADADRAVPVG